MTDARSFPMRPFLKADTERLQDLVAQSIEMLTTEEYDDNERIAWMSRVADAEAFAVRLSRNVTILVESDGDILGFGSLRDTDDKARREIDLLYVHPYAASQGVGSALLDALERIARARGAETMTVDSSDTAHDFFERRGYQGIRRNTIPIDDVWLTNTTMMKPLVKGGAGKAAGSESEKKP